MTSTSKRARKAAGNNFRWETKALCKSKSFPGLFANQPHFLLCQSLPKNCQVQHKESKSLVLLAQILHVQSLSKSLIFSLCNYSMVLSAKTAWKPAQPPTQEWAAQGLYTRGCGCNVRQAARHKQQPMCLARSPRPGWC